MDFHRYGLFLFCKKIVLDNQTKTSVVSRKNFISTENSLDQIQQVFFIISRNKMYSTQGRIIYSHCAVTFVSKITPMV